MIENAEQKKEKKQKRDKKMNPEPQRVSRFYCKSSHCCPLFLFISLCRSEKQKFYILTIYTPIQILKSFQNINTYFDSTHYMITHITNFHQNVQFIIFFHIL